MYQEYVDRMEREQTAKGRKKIVEEVCKMFGISVAKAYKELTNAGWESGRKKRKDAGNTNVTNEQLKKLAYIIKGGIRKNGKPTMSVDLARSILEANGVNFAVSNSRLRGLLREYNLSVKDSKIKPPVQKMRSAYPNQVHFVDPSVSLIYFDPAGRKPKIIGDDEQYKNKNFLEGKPKCWRYVLTDHYSSYICVRYYISMGESAVNLYDFLLYAWGLKDNDLYAFHGLPETLIYDPGAANKSKAVAKALEALRVKTISHMPGNPRAKGQVEKANDIVERQFESRLRLESVYSVDELNEAAEKWCAAFNANMIAHLDCRLFRSGKKIGARLMLWQQIKKEQIRELPDEQVCRQIFNAGIQGKKVGGDLGVSIVEPKIKRSMRYSLSHLPGIIVGLDVNVQPILVDPKPIIKVSYLHIGEIVSYEIEPIEYDEFSGLDINAPVYGENYKRLPDTTREKNTKELDKIKLNDLKAHSYISAENPFITKRIGTQVSVPQQIAIHDILIGHIEAAKRIKARLGYLPEGIVDYLKAKYPEGVPAGAIDNIARDFEAGINNAALSI